MPTVVEKGSGTKINKVLLRAFFIAYVALSAFYCIAGRLNLDEGWYLLAARMVGNGHFPYRDFAFTQPPLLPYLYAIPMRFLDGGLYLGRIITALFGVCGFLLTTNIAHRLSGNRAAVIAAALMALGGYQIYHMTIVKTYALTSALALLSVYFLFKDKDINRYSPYVSLGFMILAVGTRISFMPACLLLWVYYVYAYWKVGALRDCVGLTLFSAAFSAVLFVPFLVISPHQLFFELVTFHNINMAGVPASAIVGRKISLLKEYIIFYPHVVLMVIPGGVYLIKYGLAKGPKGSHNKRLILLSIFLVVFLVQWLAGTAQKHYQINVIPLAVILLASAAAELFDKMERREKGRLILALYILGCMTLSAVRSASVIDITRLYGQVRLPVEHLREAAGFVRANTSPGGKILTQDTYIAVEANRPVVSGLEMSIFSYFPEWDTEKCWKYQLMNRELLEGVIKRAEAEAVVISDLDFVFAQPKFRLILVSERKRLLALVNHHYALANSYPIFGQSGGTLHVYLRK